MSYSEKNQKNQGSAHKKRSLFGRRQGRALKGERYISMERLFPFLKIPDEKLTEQHHLNPCTLFEKKYSQYWLEIGFGHGERLLHLSLKNPGTGYIAAEPFVNGMAAFIKEMGTPPRDNIRVIMDDGMILAKSILPESLDGIYILNPDPWHKKRHHKRRIINHENLDVFAKILKPNGKLILTTDVEDLANWMCTHAATHRYFKWTAQQKSDWAKPPENWIATKYEKKGAKGAKKMIYLFFEKQGD